MNSKDDQVTTIHNEVFSLEEAANRFDGSPIIKRFGTWAVTTYGVECLSTRYPISFKRMSETDWMSHVKEKTWVVIDDFANAFYYASEIQERRKLFVKAGKPLRVFLCHAKEDKLVVRKIYYELIANGIEPWLDEKSILPGQNWTLEIKKAVRSSDVVVIFLSNKSVDKTGYVQKEIRIALDAADERPEGKIFLIPAKIEECKVPDRLSSRQWVDLYSQDGFELLIQSLYVCAQDDAETT
ncbi:MAG: toll/interleukin-1 receptor domain-containing protein [Anaerolineales bacterium]|nr:toll/interleukin-1 receptor domain-containing protein [Anaerolineales bacterium]